MQVDPAARYLSIIHDAKWVDLRVNPEELRPAFCLTNGQCFNWKCLDKSEDITAWIAAVENRVAAVCQTPSTTLYSILAGDHEGSHDIVHRYFQLEQPLLPQYSQWSAADQRMGNILRCLPGVRVLRQEPWECLISFICSSNNNISRITLMLDRLRKTYGDYICSISKSEEHWRIIDDVGVSTEEAHHFYSFPTPEALAAASESSLRALGLGYRARYVSEAARQVLELGGISWLEGLRGKPRLEVQQALKALSGVGPKVADCVALFSLDQIAAIPVDTHVWRIASRDYDTSLKAVKSITPTVYERVGDLFRNRFGSHAGWAHSVLFAAELADFKALLPSHLATEMDEFKRTEKLEKAAKSSNAGRQQKRKVKEELEPTPYKYCNKT